MPARIRPHVLGVARRDDRIFVAEVTDPTTDEAFYRPPGGGIEFGESSREAVVREYREELDLAVEPIEYLGTIENRFEWDGNLAHDLSVVHEVAFVDEVSVDESLQGIDTGGTVTYEATWEPLDELIADDRPLYPEGVEAVIQGRRAHVVD